MVIDPGVPVPQWRPADPDGGNLFGFRPSDQALLSDEMPMERLAETFHV